MRQPPGPWLVRIDDVEGRVRGGGTLLDEEHVLTCAHMLDPDAGAVVRVRGGDGGIKAAVRDLAPPSDEGHRGDVAVLRLAAPVAGAPRARLRRKWTVDEVVRGFGFREGAEAGGLTAFGRLSGYDLFGERVEIIPRDAKGPVIERGFSGAAALNAAGEVCGVVVSVVTDLRDASWMIGVDALLRHVPWLREYLVVDDSVNDRRFRVPTAGRSDPDTPLKRALAEWIGDDSAGGVVVVSGTEAATAVAELVGPALPAYRARVSQRERDGGLPFGSVDAALDATGRTTAEMSAAIATALGLRADGGRGLIHALEALGPPVTVVVNSVDAAADPAELCERVLWPIAVRSPLLRVRLLLGFGGEPWGRLADALVTGP